MPQHLRATASHPNGFRDIFQGLGLHLGCGGRLGGWRPCPQPLGSCGVLRAAWHQADARCSVPTKAARRVVREEQLLHCKHCQWMQSPHPHVPPSRGSASPQLWDWGVPRLSHLCSELCALLGCIAGLGMVHTCCWLAKLHLKTHWCIFGPTQLAASFLRCQWPSMANRSLCFLPLWAGTGNTAEWFSNGAG